MLHRQDSRSFQAVLPAATALALAAAILAGCGASSDNASAPPLTQPATLLLDFTPNAIHAGAYLAVKEGLDKTSGVDLTIRAPSSSTDAVKLLDAGRADFAFMDIHDLALADAKGAKLVGVMAVVERPLASVLAAPSIERPRDLEGHLAGVTGLPSDDAILDSIVKGDGGDPGRVKKITIGFNAVPSLLAGKVSAATGFWNAEGVALKAKRPGTRVFRVDDFGAPAYPELVLATSRATLKAKPALVRALVNALGQSYLRALANPPSAIAALVAGAKGVDPAGATREFKALARAFMPQGELFGALSRKRLAAWAAWEQQFGVVKRAPVVEELFGAGFLQP